jgi:hypothetical protein
VRSILAIGVWKGTWREISISLTHGEEKSKGRVVRIREVQTHELI